MGLAFHTGLVSSRERKDEDLWYNIHLYGRRCRHFENVVEQNLSQLQSNDYQRERREDPSYGDFRDLNSHFQELKGRCEFFSTFMIAIAVFLDAKQNSSDSRSVFKLTVLGAIFLPFFTIGLFSMTADYLPGGPRFRLYWFISLSITAGLVGLPFEAGLVVQLFQTALRRPRGARTPYWPHEKFPTCSRQRMHEWEAISLLKWSWPVSMGLILKSRSLSKAPFAMQYLSNVELRIPSRRYATQRQ